MVSLRDIAKKFSKPALTQEAASTMLFTAMSNDDGEEVLRIAQLRPDSVYWPGFGDDPAQDKALIPFDYALRFGKTASAAAMAAAVPELLTDENNIGRTRLFLTVGDYLPKDVGVLLHIGADATRRDKAGNTLLHAAAEFSSGDEVIKQLRPYFPDVDVVNDLGETPLMTAAAKDERGGIVTLLGWGAGINKKDKAGLNATMHAITAKKFIMAAALMARGGEIDFASTAIDPVQITQDARGMDGFMREFTNRRKTWENGVAERDRAEKTRQRQEMISTIVEAVSGGAGEVAAPARATFRKKKPAPGEI